MQDMKCKLKKLKNLLSKLYHNRSMEESYAYVNAKKQQNGTKFSKYSRLKYTMSFHFGILQIKVKYSNKDEVTIATSGKISYHKSSNPSITSDLKALVCHLKKRVHSCSFVSLISFSNRFYYFFVHIWEHFTYLKKKEKKS